MMQDGLHSDDTSLHQDIFNGLNEMAPLRQERIYQRIFDPNWLAKQPEKSVITILSQADEVLDNSPALTEALRRVAEESESSNVKETVYAILENEAEGED